MIDKKHLIKEMKEEFEKVKKELNFNSTFEELDESFKIQDAVFSAGFVSQNFSRQLCSRILDNFMNWNGYLNGLLMPSPGYLANQTEANLFGAKEDKELIWKLTKKIMAMSSEHSIIGLIGDKVREAKFIDESLIYWKAVFFPGLVKILDKVNFGWVKE